MDRAHRIGQKKEVQVFRFCVENSIEEKVRHVCIWLLCHTCSWLAAATSLCSMSCMTVSYQTSGTTGGLHIKRRARPWGHEDDCLSYNVHALSLLLEAHAPIARRR